MCNRPSTSHDPTNLRKSFRGYVGWVVGVAIGVVVADWITVVVLSAMLAIHGYAALTLYRFKRKRAALVARLKELAQWPNIE